MCCVGVREGEREKARALNGHCLVDLKLLANVFGLGGARDEWNELERRRRHNLFVCSRRAGQSEQLSPFCQTLLR